MLIQKVATFGLGIILSLGVTNSAYSMGCFKGALIGGFTGHIAGHHALLGAAAGCAIGHHEEAKKNKLNPYSTNPKPSYYPNQNGQYVQPQKVTTYY